MNPLSLSILAALTVAGCASAPDLPARYVLNANRQEGLAVVSLTLAGTPLDKVSEYEFRLREVPPRGAMFANTHYRYQSPQQHARSLQALDESRPFFRSVTVKGANSREPLDIEEGGQVQGRLAAVRLPPGEYELYSWHVREQSRIGEKDYSPQQNFGYRFRIKPGEAIYIGRLNLSIGERNAASMSIEDRYKEDMKLLSVKHPTLSTGEIISAVGAL